LSETALLPQSMLNTFQYVARFFLVLHPSRIITVYKSVSNQITLYNIKKL
jgi:hypothetical protein